MKGICVAQPWAWAILAGQERVEYRCHPTNYRGDLLLYADRTESLWQREQLAQFGGAPRWEELPRGLVVGLVELWACAAGRQGEWVWGLRNPRPVEPFAARPGKRLFDVNPHHLRILRPAARNGRRLH